MATMKATTYTAASRLLGSRSEVEVGNNTTAERSGDEIVVRLHGHAIIRLLADDTVCVRDCGYVTTTTYDRLNRFAPAGWRLRRTGGGGYAEALRGARLVVHGDRWLRLESGGYGYPE